MTADEGSAPDAGHDPTTGAAGVPVEHGAADGRDAGNAIRFRWWNLLLALPLLMLITPVFNKAEPRLFGLPLFYWFQFAFVFVGVATVAIVFTATRRASGDERENDR